MRDLWNLFRASGPQSQALHFSYEKAGLTLDNQPIPWNAEAVIVEANVRLSTAFARQKGDFRLRVAAAGPLIEPELLRQDTGDSHARLFFRLGVPAESTTAELLWRDRTLGQVTLPVVSRDEFIRQLSVQMTTAHARLGEQTVACQTFVSGQCQSLLVTGLLASPIGLAALADMALRVEVRREDGVIFSQAPLRLSGTQLRGRQALLSALMPRPRRSGALHIQWLLEGRALATLRLKAISKKHFLRSLRISATRFVVRSHKGSTQVVRSLPSLESVERVGPCFLIGSGESGIAGLASLGVFAKLDDDQPPKLLHEEEMLVTDGPMPLFGAMLDVGQLACIKHFSVEGPLGCLGILPLTPVPSAEFTSEGGFRAVEDFVWSAAAEEQLNERLSRLLGGA